MQPADTPLIATRRRDIERRRARVHKAITDMHSDGSGITIASTAARAGVHRSFIHRHGDLHPAVLAAAAETIENLSPAARTISHRSVLNENANLHATVALPNASASRRTTVRGYYAVAQRDTPDLECR